MTNVIDGDAVADDITAGLEDAIATLAGADARPTLATVLMSEDPASETYVSMKQRDCEELGIGTRDVSLDADEAASELYAAIEELNADPDVDGILVQMPTAEQVDDREVLDRIDPVKDVDGLTPENVGRTVRGNPRFRPCTPHGCQKLLEAADVDLEGADAVVVGRSNLVGRPMANLLARRAPDGNATVTLCHSRTGDLAAHTRRADVLVVAAGIPEFVDGSMLSDGVVVIDVGFNRVETADGEEKVGDVEFESAREKASAITPVPGGVGPMTRAMLYYNTVKAASLQADVDVSLP